jgi:hypothetical protein
VKAAVNENRRIETPLNANASPCQTRCPPALGRDLPRAVAPSPVPFLPYRGTAILAPGHDPRRPRAAKRGAASSGSSKRRLPPQLRSPAPSPPCLPPASSSALPASRTHTSAPGRRVAGTGRGAGGERSPHLALQHDGLAHARVREPDEAAGAVEREYLLV